MITIKGKIIRDLKDYDGRLVFVEFESQNSVGCSNDDDYALGGANAQPFSNDVYRVEGHFLISTKNSSISFHEFTPHIGAIYEWQE